MRPPAAKIFSPGAGHLVDGALLDSLDPDEMVLNCYRLADRYKQNPDVFLDMPYFTGVLKHIHFTIKLIEAQNKARAPQDDD